MQISTMAPITDYMFLHLVQIPSLFQKNRPGFAMGFFFRTLQKK
jgi:hypothetical protein